MERTKLFKIGDIVVLVPKESRWSGLLGSLDQFTDDFMQDGREEYTVPDPREW